MPAPIEVERLEKAVDGYLKTEGYEMVDLRIAGNVSRPVLEVYCDREGGITAEECGNLARSLRIKLEAEGLVDDSFTLLVSSPGLNRVLKRERDFTKYIGRKVKVKLEEPISGSKKLKGTLKGYQDGTVIISGTEDGEVALSPGRWKEIRLIPEFPEGY